MKFLASWFAFFCLLANFDSYTMDDETLHATIQQAHKMEKIVAPLLINLDGQVNHIKDIARTCIKRESGHEIIQIYQMQFDQPLTTRETWNEIGYFIPQQTILPCPREKLVYHSVKFPDGHTQTCEFNNHDQSIVHQVFDASGELTHLEIRFGAVESTKHSSLFSYFIRNFNVFRH